MIQTNLNLSKSNHGLSIVGVMVALAVTGILVMFASSTYRLSILSFTDFNSKIDLAMARGIIREKLSCKETLNITSTSAPALDCSSFPSVTLKDRTGNAIGNIGPWVLTAVCDTGGSTTSGEIIINVSRPGIDPLTKLPYPSGDLFKGASEFCRKELTPVCTGAGEYFQGFNSLGPICCHTRYTTDANNVGATTCGANEYAKTGGSFCYWNYIAPDPDPPIPVAGIPANYPGYLTKDMPVANGWDAQCYGQGAGLSAGGGSFAICCPLK